MSITEITINGTRFEVKAIPDTPEQTTKKVFVWTDELVVEFTSWSLTKSPTFQGRYADVEDFKKMKASKQSEFEKKFIRVKGGEEFKIPAPPPTFYEYDPKQSQSNTPVFDAEKINQRIEQLAEMEEVFNAARERKYIKDPSIRTISDFTHDFQYKTFSEYLSSIKKQQSK